MKRLAGVTAALVLGALSHGDGWRHGPIMSGLCKTRRRLPQASRAASQSSSSPQRPTS